jgi:hypothetical protein
MATKPKGEWLTNTIAEWAPTKAVTWKAQFSTAPDGSQFVGIRQYVVTTKLGEIASKGGFSIKLDEKADDALEAMQNMITALRNQVAEEVQGTTKPKKAVTKPAARGTGKKLSLAADGMFLLKKDTGKYLTSFINGGGVKVSSDINKAQLFTHERAKGLLDHKLSDAWSMLAHTE